MSFYVYISRKPNPTSGEGPEIPEAEWRGLIEGERDFRVPTQAERDTEGSGRPEACSFIWQRPDGDIAWFSWCDGQVEVKNADEAIIRRMSQLAGELAARVVTETGERFDAEGHHAGFEEWSDFYVAPKKPSLLSRLFGKRDGT